MLRKALLQPVDDPVGVIDGERRLRQIGQLGCRREFQPVGVLGRFDQHDRLRGFAHRADDFVVPLVADQQDRVALLGEADRFQMDLGDQRAGGVDGVQLAARGRRGEFRARRRGRRRAASTPAALRPANRRTRPPCARNVSTTYLLCTIS